MQNALEWTTALLRLSLQQETTLSDIAVAVDFCSEESFDILVSTLSARLVQLLIY